MPAKRDTSLRYGEGDLDPNDPVFSNMTQIIEATPLTQGDLDYMYSTIDKWLKANEPDVTHMRSNAEKAALNPLVTILYNKMNNKLMNYTPSFIRAAMTFVIQQRLFNLCRNTDSTKDNHNESAPPSPSGPKAVETKPSTVAPRSNPVSMADNNLDFGIRARVVLDAATALPDQHTQLSVASLGDVVSTPIVDNKSLMNQASFESWAEILRQDIDYTDSHAITYQFPEGILTIRRDRQFRAALIEAWNSGLTYAMFSITSSLPVRSPVRPPIPKVVTRGVSVNSPDIVSPEKPSTSSPEKRTISTQGGRETAKKPATPRNQSGDGNSIKEGICSSPKQTQPHHKGSSKQPGEIPGPSRPKDTTIAENIENPPATGGTMLAPDITMLPGVVEDFNTAINTEVEPEATAEGLMAKVKLTATEHLHEPGRWEQCCRLFLHDHRKITPSERIQIPGLTTPLFLYQAFGVYVMFEMEIYQGGGYNADDMGLGKTVQLLALICLNRILEVAHLEVIRARRENKFDQHLARGTSANPQPDNVQCPSGNKFGILCPCIEGGPASRLMPQTGPNLIVVPAALVPNWLQEVHKHLDLDNKPDKWEVRHAYGDAKMNKLAAKLSVNDRMLLEVEPKPGKPNQTQQRVGQSRVVIITTKGSYQGHVQNIMRDVEYPPRLPRSRKPARPVYKYWELGWGRAVVDEAHFEETPSSGTIRLFKSFGTGVRKWFLTGTPFERSPAQMAGWVATIEDEDWTEPASFPDWPEREVHYAKLKNCTSASLRRMGKTHDRIVMGKETDEVAIDQYITSLTEVLGTLWLKRSTTQSTFFGHPLTQVPSNTNFVIDCSLPSKFNQLVNSPLMSITEELKQENAAAIQKWIAEGRLGAQPVINQTSWLLKVRRLRILSSFPRLGELAATKTLALKGEEDLENGWVRVRRGELYELEECGSPYEKYITDICSPENCPKAAAITKLISEWDKDEKAVLCSMGPTNALILYWYLRLVVKAPVALIHGAMLKSKVMDIIMLFQEDSDTIERYPTTPTPRYLVGTTKLIGVGYTLHRAKRLIQLDPEWMERDQEQAKKRINRIGQQNATTTYTLQCIGSDVERTIYDRQNRRTHLMKLALDPDKFNEGILKRGVGDDEDDDLAIIDEEDAIDEAPDEVSPRPHLHDTNPYTADKPFDLG